MNGRLLRVYLAGPDVFLSNAAEIGQRKKEICAQYGFEGVFPLDNELNLDHVPDNAKGLVISEGNEKHMTSCDLVIANMTPFRGPSIDPGTAYEMGFMKSLGRMVLGYRNETLGYVERVFRFFNKPLPAYDSQSVVVGPDNMRIENFGLGDNLMVDGAVNQSGFAVIQKKVPEADRFTNLEAFEECVALAARKLLSP